MKKRIINLLILIIIILIPTISLSESTKSIIIVVDELSLTLVEEIAGENPAAIGFINLKTRDELVEENLYLSINKGRKLGRNDLKDIDKLQSLGDVLKKEKTSYLGKGKEDIILWNKNEKVDYENRNIIYDKNWLIQNTNRLLDDSNISVIGYEFQNQEKRINIFKEFLSYYKEAQIIILPKAISEENENLLNKSLVPIIYKDNQKSGLLTSESTKREGFIVIEDITAQLKKTYGYHDRSDIGNSFKIIEKENLLEKFNKTYKMTINLLFLVYVFHGFIYLSQGILAFSLLKYKEILNWIHFIYLFTTTNILVSLILGFFQFHENLFIYLFISLILSFIASTKIRKNKLEKELIVSTFGLIVVGTLIYPDIIYNSYIGFNNLVYGARYYGLNNGIVGVLLSSSILSFFIINNNINKISLKKITGILIFGINMIVLSTKFGTNTGGFITSIILFILIMYMILFTKEKGFRKAIIFLTLGLLLFVLNMGLDNISGGKSHGVQFLYRLKNNDFKEFMYIASFKARELITLTLAPPFSLVLISQGIILNKLKKQFIKYKEIKKEANIILITSLVGFFINDTGMIMLIYMLNYFILYIISNKRFQE